MIKAGTVFPLVDYAAHPAFRGFEPGPAARDAAAEEAIHRADLALDEIHGSTVTLPVAEVEYRFRTQVAPELEAIHRLCTEALPADHPIKGAADFGVNDARQWILKEALFENEKKSYQPASRVSPTAEQIASELAEDGLSLHQIPDRAIRVMYDDLKPVRDQLTDLGTHNGGRHCAVAIPRTGAYWKEILSFLHGAGIIAGCSHYRREPLELLYCALVLSHDGEQWWRGCYADVGIPTTRTVYMHNDKDYDLMKLLVYLDRVEDKHGPFCFVRGSHRWQRSRTQSFLFKGLDSASGVLLAKQEPAATTYYRKAFRHPDFRAHFLKLPKPMRGSSHFGDDVPDDWELSQWLLGRETSVTSEMANCMAFIGANGIHRGGCVREGKRWVLQLGLRKIPPMHRRIGRQAKAAYGFGRSKLRGAVRRIVGDRGIEAVRSLASRMAGR